MSEHSRGEPELVQAEPEAPGFVRRILPKLVLSIVLGGVFAWLVAKGGVPLVPSEEGFQHVVWWTVPAYVCLLYPSPSPRDRTRLRMPSSA